MYYFIYLFINIFNILKYFFNLRLPCNSFVFIVMYVYILLEVMSYIFGTLLYTNKHYTECVTQKDSNQQFVCPE